MLFLVLPVAFLNGTASINVLFAAGPPCNSGIASPTNPRCPIAIVPMPRDMALNLIFLGLIGILLGFVALKLGPRLGTSAALGLAFSLGLLAFLFETAISRTKESFSVEPFFVLAFPDLSIVAMAGGVFCVRLRVLPGEILSFPDACRSKRSSLIGVDTTSRFFVHRLSALLAVLGGVLFLVLPIAFFSGFVSIVYPLPSCYPILCLGILRFHPVPGLIALFSLFLGVIGLLLGFFVVKLSQKSGSGVPLGLAFSLGSMALLYGVVTLDVQNTFITTPASFLLFPEFSIAAMSAATLLFSYELVRREREATGPITS